MALSSVLNFLPTPQTALAVGLLLLSLEVEGALARSGVPDRLELGGNISTEGIYSVLVYSCNNTVPEGIRVMQALYNVNVDDYRVVCRHSSIQ